MRRIAVNLLARLKSQGKNVGKSNVECRRDTRKGGHYFLIAIFLMNDSGNLGTTSVSYDDFSF